MPWTCSACSVEVARDDEAVCPQCGEKKASWTLVADRTRTLQVTTRRSPLYTGESAAPVAREAGYAAAALVEAKALVAIEAPLVRRLAGAGLLPPPDCLLVVRVPAGKTSTITLVPEFERREMTEQAFADRAEDARFLLTFGGALAPEHVPEGVAAIDVGEPTARGWAPALGVTAVVRKKTSLPVTAGRRAFTWSR